MTRALLLGCLLSLFATLASAGEGHQAGYRWAASKGIDDPSYCYSRSGGYINNSRSFMEGCLDYLRDEAIINEDDEPVEENDDEEESRGWW